MRDARYCAPILTPNADAVELIQHAIEAAGWKMILNPQPGDLLEWSAMICSSPISPAFARGIADSAANALRIKFNQIGTLTERETIAAVPLTYDAVRGAIVSQHSGVTVDRSPSTLL